MIYTDTVYFLRQELIEFDIIAICFLLTLIILAKICDYLEEENAQ